MPITLLQKQELPCWEISTILFPTRYVFMFNSEIMKGFKLLPCKICFLSNFFIYFLTYLFVVYDSLTNTLYRGADKSLAFPISY
jgi:hypothetical protein